jgi:hypothetical protein
VGAKRATLSNELAESFLSFLERSAAFLAYPRKALQDFTSIGRVDGMLVLVEQFNLLTNFK